MKFFILITSLLLSTSLFAKTSCVKDPKYYFGNGGTKIVGNIQIGNRYANGECMLTISVTRKTSDGKKIDESFTFSDQGKIFNFIGSSASYPTTKNSRATGSKYFYLLPRVKENISYEVSEERLTINMANGERAIFNTKSGAIEDITNTKWRRDRALYR